MAFSLHHVFYLILYISALVANKRVHNSVGTTCTTSPEQIEVTELEGYSQPTYNKLCASSHDVLDRRRHNPQADRRRVQIKPVLRRLSVAEFSKSTI